MQELCCSLNAAGERENIQRRCAQRNKQRKENRRDGKWIQ